MSQYSGGIQDHVTCFSVASYITYTGYDRICTCARAACADESKGGMKRHAEENFLAVTHYHYTPSSCCCLRASQVNKHYDAPGTAQGSSRGEPLHP